jgi:hypothetical protein
VSVPDQSLFDLLPALYRLRDARLAQAQTLLSPSEQTQLQALQDQAKVGPLSAVQQQELDQLTAKAGRGPLQSLLMLVDEQLAVLAENLDQLYDDQFIETCAPWVIPYIGDLIGYQTVHGIAPAVASPRAEVAHTISFRRRKGTVLVLEQLARDVTGWGAHAVEFFLLLADTQYLNHPRPDNHYAPNLRGWRPRAYQNTGFDRTAHRVDVRRIAVERGRYNLPNVGIFLWSLNAYSLTDTPALPAPTGPGGEPCYRFSSLGRDLPLFNDPISQGADITAPAQPFNVPDRLSHRALCEDVVRSAAGAPAVYYGQGKSLAIVIDGNLVDPAKLQVADLSGADGSWANLPGSGSSYAAVVDPELGRLALPPPAAGAKPANVTTTYYYGFNADLGGGEYPRASTFTAAPEQIVLHVPADYPTIQAALSALPGDGVVEITDSRRYVEAAGLTARVGANGHIELRAADGSLPTVVLGDALTVTGGTDAAFDLNGLILTYQPAAGGGALPPALLHAPSGSNQLSHLGITHCTLVPGWALSASGAPDPAYAGRPTLLAEAPGLAVEIQRSIVGGLWIAGETTASLADSIVDATSPDAIAYVAAVDSGTSRPTAGGTLTVGGCTVVGKVYVSLLSLASNSVFVARLTAADGSGTPPLWSAPLWAAREQEGCVRFSYLPAGAITPRRFECIEEAKGAPRPRFSSSRYGDPGYVKLVPATPDAIRRGAHDGGELGAYHFLLAPLRETDLRVRLQEYLPVGLEFGVFYEN